jgi:class 3 adenylate cyclase
MERRLAVILVADVVGYSHLMGVDEERTRAAFRIYHTVIAEIISKHRGRIFSGAGDSLLAEFASPVEAVHAAVDIQNDTAERPLDLPEGHQMRFRIGVNLGDVMVERSDLYGDGVNVAVRLQALAEPGGICLAGNVHEHVEQKLPLQFFDLGSQRLKNIAKPVHVYRVPARCGRSRAGGYRGRHVCYELAGATVGHFPGSSS